MYTTCKKQKTHNLRGAFCMLLYLKLKLETTHNLILYNAIIMTKVSSITIIIIITLSTRATM